ncbi:uncharacterized protein BDZ99DRAFT_477205 [Mytilinidion resinicola]|uniref:SNF2 N-terminal domain-containing protein n=1 Tax=Mytilinidion resinicola TaxID=574789 RepID=A0A6A6YPD9_9PEZI|nr:uncharacterized protein BDZ99DRAFT_477205 [Mytilinidion resinicola]KAF2809845.1 hypothetical protein BDZ99DRAFT_477205 [Mytilinidion resinicola]
MEGFASTATAGPSEPAAYQTATDATRASSLHPNARVAVLRGAALLGEPVFDDLEPEARRRLATASSKTSVPPSRGETLTATRKDTQRARLIVDEDQRSKKDKSQLCTPLNAFRAPIRVLLTGTPRDSATELLNLLQFLDDTDKAVELGRIASVNTIPTCTQHTRLEFCDTIALEKDAEGSMPFAEDDELLSRDWQIYQATPSEATSGESALFSHIAPQLPVHCCLRRT